MNTRTNTLPVQDHNLLGTLMRRFRMRSATEPIKRTRPQWGRNEPCYCGRGKKYKRCCWTQDNQDN